MQSLRVFPGAPYPLGATVTPQGVNFAIFSENATGVDLCLFDSANSPTETIRIPLVERTEHVWHCLLPDSGPGQLYGFRVHGPFDPQHGFRFNASKLLLDPYAKAITGLINWGTEMFSYPQNGGEDADLLKDERDSAWCMPRCIVVDDAFDWGNDRLLRVPMSETVIYEVHVKGFSELCPDIPEDLRGSYAALGTPFAIEYFKKLGVTAVELLPVHHFVNDEFLQNKGLTNYWGYNSIGFFAPHSAYAQGNPAEGEQVREFKQMVKDLHAAGLEVIMDVVYNHTGEGNQMGPTISFRGIDNSAYYRQVQCDRRYYMDYTGTGNTLNTQHPRTIQLVMDSLRYWVEEMHVDGFRFDLASTLARESHEVSKLSGFFDCIQQDPVISRVKLIAEPWDVGEGGYQVGNFPVLWAEWNGKYRDCLRAYWKGDEGQLGELAYRLAGSADLFEEGGRKPYASVNFLTAHDGFTLNDTVSFNEKHNEANGENSQDGHNDNRSWNCGAEGPTEDEAVNALRRRQLRNLLTTLILSQGVPMLLGGDEFGRSQKGNNNAYCQDNEISWFDWNLADWQKTLRDFTTRLIGERRRHPVFRRPKYFQGRRIAAGVKDIMWFSTNGTEMTQEEWNSGHLRCLGMMLSGDTMDIRDEEGKSVRDDTFLMLFNAHHEPVKFELAGAEGVDWEVFLDTKYDEGAPEKPMSLTSGDEFELIGRSMAILRLAKGTQEAARSVAWKRQQQAEPIAPPRPARSSRFTKVEATTSSVLEAEKNKPEPTVSELAQNIKTPRRGPTK